MAIYTPNLSFFLLPLEQTLSPLQMYLSYFYYQACPSPSLPTCGSCLISYLFVFLFVFPYSLCSIEWCFQNENQVIIWWSEPAMASYDMETQNPSHHPHLLPLLSSLSIGNHMASLLFLKQTRNVPTSRPLHLKLTLPKMLSPRIRTWLASFLHLCLILMSLPQRPLP